MCMKQLLELFRAQAELTCVHHLPVLDFACGRIGLSESVSLNRVKPNIPQESVALVHPMKMRLRLSGKEEKGIDHYEIYIQSLTQRKLLR